MDERWVDADGKRLFVRTWGETAGRPVLYWHGVGLTSSASLTLGPRGPGLAAHGLYLIALDAPGFGRSPPLDPGDYHPHALADLVPPLLDSIGLDRAAFMGFSWGGDLGLHVAARHHERLTALVILDAGYEDPPFDPSQPFESYLEDNERAWKERCEPSWEAALARVRQRFHGWTPALEQVWRAAWREERGRLVPSASPSVVAAAEHGTAQALPSTVRPALAATDLPVFLVASGDTSEEDLARFAADVPQAEIHHAKDVAHDVLNDGGPKLVQLVGEWLAANA